MKKLKINIITLLLLASHFPGFAQLLDSSIVEKFNQYQSNNYQEKIFVHTDKDFFLAGETIWFKVYDVDAFFNKPSSNSGVCYIELIDSNHLPVFQTKISLKNGKATGSCIIPFTVSSAHYLLRAYTNWMKNFDASLYFQKDLTIINTARSPNFNIDTLSDSKNYNIQFFPEGGNLVAGINAKIGFKINDENEKGVDATGILEDDKNSIITNFKTLKFGMGNFSFTPQPNIIYHAVITIKDKKIIQSFPKIYENGYCLSLQDLDTDNLKLSVKTNISSNKLLYLFIQCHNILTLVQQKDIEHNEVQFLIKKKDLQEGISQFTLFNEQRKPVCERLYFKTPTKELKIVANTDKKVYSTKSEGIITINTSGENYTKIDGDLSLSIFKTDDLQKPESSNILTYIYLSSDLNGKIESSDFYFQPTDSAVEAADNLMLTQGWRRFKWEDVLKNQKPAFSYLPEKEGFLIKGVISKNGSAEAKNTRYFLNIPDKAFGFASAKSDDGRNIFFNIGKVYGRKSLVFQTDDRTDGNYLFNIENPFSEKFSGNPLSGLIYFRKWNNALNEKSIDMQVDNSTDLKEKYHYVESNDTLSFYAKPDWQYYLDNYTRFTTMEEVLHEYVTDLRVKKSGNDINFNVGNDNYKTFFDANPLVLIDGVPVFDNKKIMELDPLKIKRLDIVARKFYTGSLTNQGILSFATYEGNLSGYHLDTKSIVIEYDGLQKEREFYTPVYKNQKNDVHFPDFRNVLLWSPYVETKAGYKEINFSTSEVTGHFSVVIQGITDNGLCGYQLINFEVKK